MIKFINKLQKSKNDLEKAIMDKMDKIARKHRLDSMSMAVYSTSLKRNGKEIQLQSITKLEELYCEHIHSGGFQALWLPGKGWQ
jgi:hypothetical protein